MNFLTDIKQNWMLVLFVGSLIVGWTTFGGRLSNVEAQAQENKEAIEILANIQLDIALIKQDLEYIKRKVQ